MKYSTINLEEKWETQKKLAEKAGFSAKTYIKNAEVTAKKFAAQHKIKLKYVNFN